MKFIVETSPIVSHWAKFEIIVYGESDDGSRTKLWSSLNQPGIIYHITTPEQAKTVSDYALAHVQSVIDKALHPQAEQFLLFLPIVIKGDKR